MIGRIFSERYQLKKYLGGGMSSVYIASDIILERDVVVKLIKVDPNNLDKSKNRFLREVQSTIKLSHQNVVSVYDVDDSDEYQILVTEVIIGPTLKTYVQDNHPLAIEEVVSLSRMILDGIGYAHDSGIIHRDIKPQYILLNEQNDVKITDFGIAKAMSETRMTETNQVMGSVQYISPEQAKGQSTDERTDIYSFGIVLYEMLAGDVPYHGETPVSIAIKQISEPMPDILDIRPDVPAALQRIIKKCTEKDMGARYRHVSDVYQDLLSFDLSQGEDDEEEYVPDEAQYVNGDNAESDLRDAPLSASNPPKRNVGCLLGLIFIFLILLPLLYIGYILMTDETRNDVSVPTLTGMTVEEAAAHLDELETELSIGDISERYDESAPIDTIVEMNPESGVVVARGTTIDVVVSLGREPTGMPDFRGNQYDDVLDEIEALAFLGVEVEEVYTETDNAGEILEQSIAPETMIFTEDETLSIIVSEGIEMVEVESFIGFSEAQAIEEIEALGLEAEVIQRLYSNSVQSGFVMMQSPEDGELEIGETIQLTISVGPEPPSQRPYSNTVDIPYTYQRSEEDEDDEDEDEDEEVEEEPVQIVRVYISDVNHSIDNVYEVFGITADSRYTVNMTILENSAGRYVITVDDEVIIDATIPY